MISCLFQTGIKDCCPGEGGYMLGEQLPGPMLTITADDVTALDSRLRLRKPMRIALTV